MLGNTRRRLSFFVEKLLLARDGAGGGVMGSLAKQTPRNLIVRISGFFSCSSWGFCRRCVISGKARVPNRTAFGTETKSLGCRFWRLFKAGVFNTNNKENTK